MLRAFFHYNSANSLSIATQTPSNARINHVTVFVNNDYLVRLFEQLAKHEKPCRFGEVQDNFEIGFGFVQRRNDFPGQR